MNRDLVVVCRNFKVDTSEFINPLYVGVETGITFLLENNLPMAFACGDCDTLSSTQLEQATLWCQEQQIEFIKYDSQKDFLDSELAIETALERFKDNVSRLIIVADGTRWDMLLASISLVRRYQHLNPIIIGDHNYCFILQEGDKHQFSSQQTNYPYVSFLSDEANYSSEILLSGFQYGDNQKISISVKDTLALSNVFKRQENPSFVEVIKGKVIVVLSH